MTLFVVFIFSISTQFRLSAQSEQAPSQNLLFLNKRQGTQFIIYVSVYVMFTLY